MTPTLCRCVASTGHTQLHFKAWFAVTNADMFFGKMLEDVIGQLESWGPERVSARIRLRERNLIGAQGALDSVSCEYLQTELLLLRAGPPRGHQHTK